MEAVLNNISGLLWGWPMVIILLGTHLFMTFRLKIPQRKLFTAIKLSVTKEDGQKGDVSSQGTCFGAVEERASGEFTLLDRSVVIVPSNEGVEYVISAMGYERNVDRALFNHALGRKVEIKAIAHVMSDET